MSVITIEDGATIDMDSNDSRVFLFDWDAQNLAAAVTISTSSFTILGQDAALAKDQESIVAGSRKTQLRLSNPTPGVLYEVANKIVTSESPTQTKERSFFVRGKA